MVGEAATLGEAIRRVALDIPHSAMLDLNLPEGQGIDACERIKVLSPHIRSWRAVSGGDLAELAHRLLPCIDMP
ncbi:MAG: hypothetical protein WEF28_02965 [Acidimicrobiia bacterium]